MRFNVMLRRLLGVIAGVKVMPVGQVCMVSGCFVISVGVVFRGFAVVASSVLVMVRCLVVMMSCFFCHGEFPHSFELCSKHVRIISRRHNETVTTLRNEDEFPRARSKRVRPQLSWSYATAVRRSRPLSR
jgi:hypothetical protein